MNDSAAGQRFFRAAQFAAASLGAKPVRSRAIDCSSMVFVDSNTRLCIELLHIPVEGVSDFREISAPLRIFLHIRRRVCHTAMLEVWQAYLQASNNDIERLWDSHLERAASLSVLGRWVAALRELVTTGQAVLARSRIDARRLRRLTSRRSQWEYAR